MADSSFDIVSKVDKMEADNAVNQAQKEVAQRYDFKGVGASIEWSGEKLLLKASAEERVKAVLEVLESKMIKRGISLRSLDTGEPYASGKEFRIEVGLKNGIGSDDAKKISKIIRDEGPKSVNSQIQGDELRVQSKSRDDLQATMALLKASAEERVKAVLEVLESKMIKRGIGIRSLDTGAPYASGKEFRIEVGLKNGISSDDAKKIAKIIREEGPKSVKSQIQGDELRVQSKSRDDLQATMALLKGKDLDVALQFVNFR